MQAPDLGGDTLVVWKLDRLGRSLCHLVDTVTGQKLRVAREMYASGQYTVAAIARTLGVSRASIYRHLSNADGRPRSSAHGAADR